MIAQAILESLYFNYQVRIDDTPFRSFEKTVYITFFDENGKKAEEFKLGYVSPETIYKKIEAGEDLNLNNAYIKDFSLTNYRVDKGFDDSVYVELKNLQSKKAFFDCDIKTDFSYARFVGEKTIFDQAVFSHGNVDFVNADFGDGQVSFKKAKFGNGNVVFQFAAFGQGDVTFAGACFGHGTASFVNTGFGKGNVDFKSTVWGNGNVDFKFAKFEDGDVTFERSSFGNGKKDFKNLEFGGGKIDFRRVNFNNGDVSFEGVEFGEGKVLFRSAVFGEGEKHFDEADFGKGEVQFDQVDFGGGLLSFHMVKADTLSFHGCGFNLFVDLRMAHCNFINMSNTIVRDIMDFEPEDEEIHIATINFRGMKILGRLFIDWRINRVESLIYSQTETTIFQKAEQFRLLKENFRNNGQYEDEDHAYIEFKRCESKAILLEELAKGKKNAVIAYPTYYFQKYVFDFIGRYGTAPTRVLFNMIVVFFTFSLIYFTFSISETLAQYGYVMSGGVQEKFADPKNSIGIMALINEFGNCLYYSGITFFTVGYGDYFGYGILKPISVFEGFSGVFLMSYFTVAFVRKILR